MCHIQIIKENIKYGNFAKPELLMVLMAKLILMLCIKILILKSENDIILLKYMKGRSI